MRCITYQKYIVFFSNINVTLGKSSRILQRCVRNKTKTKRIALFYFRQIPGNDQLYPGGDFSITFKLPFDLCEEVFHAFLKGDKHTI